MPRVFEAKAAKDYPDQDIKKGDTYYYWSNFRGPKQRSKTRPRPSQTTGSSKLANVYAVNEALEDALADATTPEDIIAALDEAYNGAEECVSEYEEAVSNLEEAFQGGCPALDETNEAKDTLEAWRDELDSAKSEVESLDASDYMDNDKNEDGTERKVEDWDDLTPEEQESMLQAAQDAANGVSLGL